MGAKKPEPLVITSLEQLDEMMGQRALNLRRDTRAKATYDKVHKEVMAQNKAIENAIAAYVSRRRRWIFAHLGKTLRLTNGVVTVRDNAPSLDTPRVVKPIVALLLRRRGGNTYLIEQEPKLNRDAITNAPKSLQRELRPFGVWVGRHETISLRVTGEEEAVTIASRRIREVRPAAKKD